MALLALLIGADSAQAVLVRGGQRLIEIGVVPDAERVELSLEGPFTAIDARGRRRTLSPRQVYAAEATDDGLVLGSAELDPPVRLEPASPSAAVRVKGRRYSGEMTLKKGGAEGTLSLVEAISFEDYLAGVVPNEMDPDWPLEALKAQAVVARTFAYTQLGKYKGSGFDLTSDTRSQVYGGLGDSSPAVKRALAQTRGEVLGYKGKMLEVYYHSCCGGHTADPVAVWGPFSRTSRPLRGVRDRHCDGSPHMHWNAYFSDDEILAALQRRRMVGGRLRRFDIARKTSAGYAIAFRARIGEETVTVKAGDFRLALGAKELKSLRITRVIKSSRGVTFVGSGSGHGVGLCQWGAKLQAASGRGYEQILKFYFPGAVLSVIDE